MAWLKKFNSLETVDHTKVSWLDPVRAFGIKDLGSRGNRTPATNPASKRFLHYALASRINVPQESEFVLALFKLVQINLRQIY